MGRQYITPQQDASIYQQFPTRNAGFDEIIEVGKSRATNGSIRGLIQFDMDKFIAPFSSSFFLNLRIAHAEKFQRNQIVEIYTVSESWDEGTGFFEQDLRNPQDGASWVDSKATGSIIVSSSFTVVSSSLQVSESASGSINNHFTTSVVNTTTSSLETNAESSKEWDTFAISGSLELEVIEGSFSLFSSSFSASVTQSFFTRSINSSSFTGSVLNALLGGTTGSLIATQSFDWKPEDVRINITGQVRAWMTSSVNNGLLIKIPVADEESNTVNTNVRFFSRNTHTIYPPTIEAVWNTQTMSVAPNCGLSLAPEEIEIFVTNMRPEMISGSVHRIRLGVRNANTVKSFGNVATRFKTGFFLPSGSHIGIQDAATKAFVVPFDTGSLLSADNTGSYFDLKIENMYIQRSYKILVRIEKPWGDEVVDTAHRFRVV